MLIAVAERSLALVPNIDEGLLVYYLRIHDTTLKVPEYLLNDLVLGKRQHPRLTITNSFLFNLTKIMVKDHDVLALEFGFFLELENDNLVWADEVRIGLIHWCNRLIHSPSGSGRPHNYRLSNHLRSYLEILERPQNNFCEIEHYIGSVSGKSFHESRLEPFKTEQTVFNPVGCIPLRIGNEWPRYSWKAAIYLICEGSPPIWYQVHLEVNDALIKFAETNDDLTLQNDVFEIERFSSERPIVSW